jgi:hypothetical protein
MAMAGDPIGLLFSVVPYENMYESNEVALQKLSTPCKNKHIFVPYLSSKFAPFVFKGY